MCSCWEELSISRVEDTSRGELLVGHRMLYEWAFMNEFVSLA